MSYGAQVSDESGEVIFDIEDLSIRSTFSISVPGGSSGSFVVSDFDENKGVISVDFLAAFDSINDVATPTWSWQNTNKLFSYDLSGVSSNDLITFNFLSFL